MIKNENIGGWNHGPEPFSHMVHNEVLRKNFIRNSINFLQKNRFDGLGKLNFLLLDIYYLYSFTVKIFFSRLRLGISWF